MNGAGGAGASSMYHIAIPTIAGSGTDLAGSKHKFHHSDFGLGTDEFSTSQGNGWDLIGTIW